MLRDFLNLELQVQRVQRVLVQWVLRDTRDSQGRMHPMAQRVSKDLQVHADLLERGIQDLEDQRDQRVLCRM